MGKLMLNGINYTGGDGGGTGDLTAVELTKAQYDALTPAQKEDTTKLYMVTDYSPGGGGGGSGDLKDLGDVNITSPTDGQVLTYDSASQKWINAAGGGGGSSAQKVDIFNGASTITPTHSVGITVSTSNVSDMTGAMSGSEWSDGYEGFNIALKNLTVGEGYMLNFNFQFSNTVFFEGMYRVGYLVDSSNRTDYDRYTRWEDNLDRDLDSHRHTVFFVASASTMYLCFNLCGCTDGQTNYWSISDFYVKSTSSGGDINYSLSEQDTGLKWIDGSAVYQKTYQYNSVVGGGGYIILDTDIKQNTTAFIELVQLSMRIQPEIATNLYSNTIGGLHAEVAANNTGLYFENTTGYDVYSFTLTVRYTKSSS